MATLLKQLALVSQSTRVVMDDLLKVSAALQKQASRDLAPIWEISATVDPFAKLEDVPLGYWPLIVMDDIGVDAAGVHEDKDGQPFALISASTTLDDWSLTASHEMIEMLVDPFGNRLVASDSPMDGQGRISVLVEVCDPSESAENAYTANGILVSDFYTPNYLDPVVASGVRYSYTGAITEPRQVLHGGYLSWVELDGQSLVAGNMVRRERAGISRYWPARPEGGQSARADRSDHGRRQGEGGHRRKAAGFGGRADLCATSDGVEGGDVAPTDQRVDRPLVDTTAEGKIGATASRPARPPRGLTDFRLIFRVP